MKRLAFILLFICLIGANAHAAIISESSFVNPTIIDFDNAPSGLINSFYSGIGVVFQNLDGGNVYNVGHGYSPTATNFYTISGFPQGIATFSSPVTRVGFDITTNPGDNTTVSAFLNGSFVGSEYFVTSGGGYSGSFAGIEFLSGFNQVIIQSEYNVNGAFAIDNFRYQNANAVPIPGAFLLFGPGLACLGLLRKRFTN